MLATPPISTSRNRGFTLLELGIVVAIMGVLAAIAIPSFMAQRQRAYDVYAQTNCRNTQTAMKAVYSSNLRYATNWTDLVGFGLRTSDEANTQVWWRERSTDPLEPLRTVNNYSDYLILSQPSRNPDRIYVCDPSTEQVKPMEAGDVSARLVGFGLLPDTPERYQRLLDSSGKTISGESGFTTTWQRGHVPYAAAANQTLTGVPTATDSTYFMLSGPMSTDLIPQSGVLTYHYKLINSSGSGGSTPSTEITWFDESGNRISRTPTQGGPVIPIGGIAEQTLTIGRSAGANMVMPSNAAYWRIGSRFFGIGIGAVVAGEAPSIGSADVNFINIAGFIDPPTINGELAMRQWRQLNPGAPAEPYPTMWQFGHVPKAANANQTLENSPTATDATYFMMSGPMSTEIIPVGDVRTYHYRIINNSGTGTMSTSTEITWYDRDGNRISRTNTQDGPAVPIGSVAEQTLTIGRDGRADLLMPSNATHWRIGTRFFGLAGGTIRSTNPAYINLAGFIDPPTLDGVPMMQQYLDH